MACLERSSLRWITFVLMVVLPASGCGKAYLAEGFDATYKPRVKVIAVMLFPEAPSWRQFAKGDGVLREAIFHELTQQKDRYSVEFQDLAETDKRLLSAGMPADGSRRQSASELCRLLDVDAVMKCGLTRYRKGGVIGEREAEFGSSTLELFPDTEVNAGVAMYDGATGELVWQINMKASGMFYSSPAKVARQIGVKVAKKFPYRRR